jgi:hypothetical protein
MDRLISRRSILAGIASSAIPAVLPIELPARRGTPAKTPDAVADELSPVDPGSVEIQGFPGMRCRNNERARLLPKPAR